MLCRFFPTFAVMILFCQTLDGQQTARDPKKELAIWSNLTAVAPGALETFQRATVAMDKGDYAQAAQLYREVMKQAPQFSPVVRRLGLCLGDLGQTDEALSLLQNAVKLDRSPENLISLARTLAYPGKDKESTQAQKEVAFSLAKEASEQYQGSDDSGYLSMVAQLALSLEKTAEFRQALERLIQKYPDQIGTRYFNAIRFAMDEDWIAAEDEIRKAESLGLPAAAVQQFLDSGVHTRATAWRWAHYSLYLVAAWVTGLVVLFVAGKIFSKLTLRFIERDDFNALTGGAEFTLRKFYRLLINAAGSYYYFSIPFVIFLVLAVAGSIVYGFLILGHIPIKLVVILVIGAIVTVYKMIQSLFTRVSSEDPGRSLSVEEAPGLWSLTREVANRLGTRPLDEIRVLPGTEMAVYERGTYSERRQDVARRILVMGLGLIPGFGQQPFRAVLAHEYGHLSNRDTAGGDVALRVNQDMMKFALAMVNAGQAVWWNIAFQFLRLYHFLFLRISHGATRLQEVLADRAAARAYGAQPFEDGLRHVVRRQIEFDHFAGREIQEALKAGRGLQNVYTLEMQAEKTLEKAIDGALNRQTTEDDTHPSPVDRFRLVKSVVCQSQPLPSGSMWDLFADREAITKEMNCQIEQMVKAATPYTA